MRQNSKTIGERSEGIILAELLKRGEVVLQPFGDNQPYDLAVDRGGKFFRIQCKTVHLKDGKIECWTQRNSWWFNKSYSYKGEVDFFAFYCVENEKVYLVSMDTIGNSTTFSLRVNPSKNGQKAKVHWASEFEYKGPPE